MIDPITGALIGGAASLAGSYMQNKSNEKMAKQSAKNRANEIGMIKQYGQRATESMLPAYQASQGARQQGMDMSLGLAGETFRPMVETMQTGDYMAQQALLAGMMGQRNAILGDSINYGALQGIYQPTRTSSLITIQRKHSSLKAGTLSFQRLKATRNGITIITEKQRAAH